MDVLGLTEKANSSGWKTFVAGQVNIDDEKH